MKKRRRRRKMKMRRKMMGKWWRKEKTVMRRVEKATRLMKQTTQRLDQTVTSFTASLSTL